MSIKLRDKVVVITGASSGIGRATARLFASAGASVVLAARSRQSLEEAAVECERAGAPALAVPTDVRDGAAVCELARRAVERFGRIDVWVNNAGVMLYERFPEASSEAFRQVLETNVFGYVHGASAVLPLFHKQGRGVLINIASVLGEIALPYSSAYSTSKSAIRGLSEALRGELQRYPGIHVCTVLPATIDTPLYQHAANYTGRAIQPIPPLYSAEKVARAIVGLAARPRREKIVGAAGHLLVLAHRIAPGPAARALLALVERVQFLDQPTPPTPGNLYEPMPQWDRVSGGWKRGVRRLRLLKLALGGLARALPFGARKRAAR